jgi:teichuronic acid biosynthesis glycosyltransferase TuaC
MNSTKVPRVLVFTGLFPSAAAPTAGTFIRERMLRVAKHVPLVIVAPQPWSPVDWLVRLFFRKTFRPQALAFETVEGVDVYRPTYFCVPGIFKRLDGKLMALGASSIVNKLAKEFQPNLIDSHFLYPDGYAASRLAAKLKLPLTITIRGSKDEWLIGTSREAQLKKALQSATALISVSEALRQNVVVALGESEKKCTVIGNGVDLEKFEVIDKQQARVRLGIPMDAKVLISVGGLIARKGFHRVIPLLKELRKTTPNLIYLIVGGGTSQADMLSQLTKIAADHGVSDIVRFCGPQLPTELKWFYGAADVFTLATEHEGWANVFLEAMACGLPVVTTAVGGNAEVVKNENLGTVVPFFDERQYLQALDLAIRKDWDRRVIISYAQSNTWDKRVHQVLDVFNQVLQKNSARI